METNAIKLFNPKDIEFENNRDYLMKNIHFSGFFTVETIPNCAYPQINSQLYTIWKTNELRKKYQDRNNVKYDIVFKLRMDAYFDAAFCSESLFHIYYTSNFKKFIYVAADNDHIHIGNPNGCNNCNIAYWEYGHIHKHYGDHVNDICDFIAISSATNIDYYSSLYLKFESFYQKKNNDICDRLHISRMRNTSKSSQQNISLPEEMNDMYKHFIIKSEQSKEFKIITKMPFYPEAFLRIYLKDFFVISNRYFRIMFKST